MSWGGFKKAINRAGASVTVKTVDKVMDKDFDVEERRYKTLKSAGERLQKSSKSYLDNIRAVTRSQVVIAEIVSNLYEESKQGGQHIPLLEPTTNNVFKTLMKRL